MKYLWYDTFTYIFSKWNNFLLRFIFSHLIRRFAIDIEICSNLQLTALLNYVKGFGIEIPLQLREIKRGTMKDDRNVFHVWIASRRAHVARILTREESGSVHSDRFECKNEPSSQLHGY